MESAHFFLEWPLHCPHRSLRGQELSGRPSWMWQHLPPRPLMTPMPLDRRGVLLGTHPPCARLSGLWPTRESRLE